MDNATMKSELANDRSPTNEPKTLVDDPVQLAGSQSGDAQIDLKQEHNMQFDHLQSHTAIENLETNASNEALLNVQTKTANDQSTKTSEDDLLLSTVEFRDANQQPENTQDQPEENPENTQDANQQPENTQDANQQPENTQDQPEENAENTQDASKQLEYTRDANQQPENTQNQPEEHPENNRDASKQPENTQEQIQEHPEQIQEQTEEQIQEHPEQTQEKPQQELEKNKGANEHPEQTQEKPQQELEKNKGANEHPENTQDVNKMQLQDAPERVEQADEKNPLCIHTCMGDASREKQVASESGEWQLVSTSNGLLETKTEQKDSETDENLILELEKATTEQAEAQIGRRICAKIGRNDVRAIQYEESLCMLLMESRAATGNVQDDGKKHVTFAETTQELGPARFNVGAQGNRVVVRVNSNRITIDDAQLGATQYKAILENAADHSLFVLYNLEKMSYLNVASMLLKLEQIFKPLHGLLEQKLASWAAFIPTNAVITTTLSAILTFYPSQVPSQIFPTLDACKAYLRNQEESLCKKNN